MRVSTPPFHGVWTFLLCVLLCAAPAIPYAQSPQTLIEGYAAQARISDSTFGGFSPERGRDFYYRTHRQPEGDEYACASCHHQDPRREQFAHHDRIPCRACHFPGQYRSGGHTIRRQLLPFAPATNDARFTDPARVETWFDKNCTFVLGRACTAVEKGDLITWLLSLEPMR